MSLTKAKAGEWTKNYHTVGQLKAIKTVNVSSQSAGVIKKLYIKPDTEVKTGDLILELEHHVESAHVKLQKADFALQQELFHQQESLYQKKMISYSQYLQAKNNLKRTEALLKEAKAQLNQKYIQAPFSGVLGIPEVQLGEYITPGQQHIVSLQQMKTLYLDFYIPEKYYKSVQVGENISFKTNQEKNYTHQAQIVAIQPTSEKLAHTIWVRAKIKNQKHEFIPGLFVHLQLPIQRIQSAVFVPNNCILGSTDGPIVFTAEAKQNPATKKINWWITQRKIKIDLSKKQNTLVLLGLKAHEYVVQGGTQKVRDQSWAVTANKGIS